MHEKRQPLGRSHQLFLRILTARNKGDFCLRMREKVKNSFCFALFVHALREVRFSVLLNLSIQPSKETHSLIVPQ